MIFHRYLSILSFIALIVLTGCAKITPPSREALLPEEVVELRVIVVPTSVESEEIYSELKEGRPFWVLAQERSVHSSSTEGGYLGSVRKKELGKDFQQALEGLREGDYSRVFKTEDGYYRIIQLTTTKYFKDALDLYLKGDLDEAAKGFMKDLSLNPDNLYSYISLGVIYDQRGDYERAIEMHKAALDLDPGNETIYNNLATTYFNLDRPKAAIEAYKKALEIAPDSPDIKNNLAWVYASEGINLDEGITMVQILIQKEPKKAKYLETLSELFYRKGMYEDALTQTRKAIEIEPDSEHLRAQLKKIEEAKNRRLQISMKEEKTGFDIGVRLKDAISEGTTTIEEPMIVTEAKRGEFKIPADKKMAKRVNIKVLSWGKKEDKEIIKAIKKMGYKVSMIGKAEKLNPYTTIYFRKGFKDVAEKIGQNLKGRQIIRPLTWDSIFDIIILVGQ